MPAATKLRPDDTPLFFGNTEFDSLFPQVFRIRPTVRPGGLRFFNLGISEFFVTGVPGAFNPSDGSFLAVAPNHGLVDTLQARMAGLVLGGFRLHKTEYWSKRGLIQLYAYDTHRMTEVLVAYLPLADYGRFGTYRPEDVSYG